MRNYINYTWRDISFKHFRHIVWPTKFKKKVNSPHLGIILGVLVVELNGK